MSPQFMPGEDRPHPRAATVAQFVARPALLPGARRAIVALWLSGAAIVGAVAASAAIRQSAVSGLLFAMIAVALVVLAVFTRRAARWALVVSVALLALQVVGAIGSAWQLVHGVTGDKAAQLRRLGFDPTLGVALNLGYSATAIVILVYAWRGTTREAASAATRTRGG